MAIQKQMQSILAALEQQRKLKQSGVVAILEAKSAPSVTVHTYLTEEQVVQAPPPPGGDYPGLIFPPVYDHNGQMFAAPS